MQSVRRGRVYLYLHCSSTGTSTCTGTRALAQMESPMEINPPQFPKQCAETCSSAEFHPDVRTGHVRFPDSTSTIVRGSASSTQTQAYGKPGYHVPPAACGTTISAAAVQGPSPSSDCRPATVRRRRHTRVFARLYTSEVSERSRFANCRFLLFACLAMSHVLPVQSQPVRPWYGQAAGLDGSRPVVRAAGAYRHQTPGS